MMRYQLQDIRCSKTNVVATHSLARVSKSSAEFKLDVPQHKAKDELETLQKLAEYHELESLNQITHAMINAFI